MVTDVLICTKTTVRDLRRQREVNVLRQEDERVVVHLDVLFFAADGQNLLHLLLAVSNLFTMIPEDNILTKTTLTEDEAGSSPIDNLPLP